MSQSKEGQGFSSVQIRQYNQRLLLQRLRRLGDASKADLVREVGLSAPSIGQIIADLERAGLVYSIGKRHDGSLGQPATLLRVNPDGAYGIGVRIDRSRIEVVLINMNGRIIDQRTHDRGLPTPADAVALIAEDIRAILARCAPEVQQKIVGIGLARPYKLGSWLDRLDLDAAVFRLWDEAQVGAALEGATGIEVFEENDGTAAAVAELFHHAEKAQNNFFYLFIGPCIGGGIVLNGQCHHGQSGNAGDVALMPVAPSALDSVPPPPDGRDILMSRASCNALLRHLRHHGVTVERISDLAAAFDTAPAMFDAWLEDCANALVTPVLSMHALLDVPLVIVDGDLPRSALRRLISRLEGKLAAAKVESCVLPSLEMGNFGKFAGAIGAASLPLFINFNPRYGSPGGAVAGERKGQPQHGLWS